VRGNPDNLRRAAAAKSSAAKARAEQGLREMIRRGDVITFRSLAQTAGVSLDFLYRNDGIRGRVEHQRAARPRREEPAGSREQQDQPSSIVRTLTAQLADSKRRHREETAALRQALEQAHGENLILRRQLGAGTRAAEPGGIT
jgi:hypothetical protein